MSESIRQQAALRQALDGEPLDTVIRTARRLVADLEGSDMRASQLRNVLDVATDTSSIEAIANFIRYQIGRSREWRHEDFGENVVAEIRDGVVQKQAQRVAQHVETTLKKSGVEVDRERIEREAYLELTRLFLGYLNRAFHYSNTSKVWDYVL